MMMVPSGGDFHLYTYFTNDHKENKDRMYHRPCY